MAYYIGLDVSQKQTSICVVDQQGKVFAQGGALTRPGDIVGWINNRVETSQAKSDWKQAI